MPLWEEFLDTMLAFAFTAGVAGLVIGPLFFFFRQGRLLPLQRLRKGKWFGSEVWLAFILLLFIPFIVLYSLDHLGLFQTSLFEKPPSLIRKEIWANPLTMLLTLASLFLILFLGAKTRPSHLGITSARWPQNTMLGYFGFLVLTPVVLGLYCLILVFIREETHPLVDLSKESLMPIEWVLIFFRATLSAALVEEVFFRGVLQGWLRRASFAGHVTIILITLALGLNAFFNSRFPLPDQPPRDPNPWPLCFAIVMALGYGCAVYRVWSPVIWEGGGFFFPADERPDAPDVAKIKETGFSEVILPSPRPISPEQPPLTRQRWHEWEKKNALLAIFGSAMVFAAFHSNVWPSPMPLFILGLGLGFLAYRTQSLLPGIVVHCLFNTVACLVLVLSLIRAK